MSRNIWIGIVVVIVLVAGGWWYLNQSNVPATSETTQLPISQGTTNTQTPTKPSVPAVQTPTSNTKPATASKPASNEVSFATPVGYVIEKEPSYQDAAWHEVSGIDKRISIVKEQYANYSGPGIGGSASIIIDFYRNPQNLTVEQWMKTKDYSVEGSSAYTLDGITGRRFAPEPGQHNYDVIALRHKDWIVYIGNSYDTQAEVQTFNQLIASITFAK